MSSVVITGANGFIGTHAVIRLAREPDVRLRPVNREAFEGDELVKALRGADFVLHFAGVNRGSDEEIESGNTAIANRLMEAVAAAGSKPHVVFASSSQRHRDNAYGRSKLAAETILAEGLEALGARVTIAEMTNVFGPGCRPFYNSVVATFCHQLTHGEQPEIHVDNELELVWVVDLADRLADIATGRLDPPKDEPWVPGPTAHAKVSEILGSLERLARVHFDDRLVPDFESGLEANLYRTLVTYAEPGDHAYQPTLHADDRGYLFEVVKQMAGGGQVFFSTTKPGVTRGNHYHTRKYEKFCVVRGRAAIRLRRLRTDKVLEYAVDGDNPTVVDIPLFHTHSIENIGDAELLTLFWSNELFDPEDGDTHPEAVLR